MRQQRLTEALSHRNQIGFIKPAIVIFLCSAVFVGGLYLSIAGPYANDESGEPALQKSGATVETFEIDTSGIIGGQSLSVGGQLRVNNTLVLSPSSQPAETSAGQIYFDEGAKEIRYYDGTSFQGLASTGDVEAALEQQPPAQQPVAGSASQNITNITQQTINNYESATGTVTETGNNTFTGANTFTDISVEDFTASGAAALQGSLTVTGTTLLGPASASSLLLSSALDVSSGGTGRDTFNANEIVIGQGTGALATISNGAPGLCLLSTAGVPSFQACPGGGSAGVSSLAGLTGDLLVANSSTSGSTITIDTATSTNRGLASFNATNLTVTGGSVNTVQNISVTSAPTFAGITVNGLINGQTISSAASLTGTLSVAGATTATGGVITNSITSASGLSVGSSAQTLSLQGGASSTFSATTGANTTTLQFQTPTANANYRFATATAGTYDVCTTSGNCVGVGGSVSTSGGTNGQIAKFDSSNNIVDSLLSESGVTVTADGNFNIAAGSEYQIDGVQISSSVLSNDSNLAKLNASQTFSGQTIFRNTVDSSAALSLQNAAGNDIATLNTTNGSFELGDSSTLDGKLVVRNATNNFTVTVNASNPTGSHTVSLGNESGTICLQNSSGCGFITGAAANANYVQNQSSAQQVGGNFWIAGTGRADTALQAPVFDAASSGALTLGGANATSIAVTQNMTLAASKSLLITGGATGTRPAVPTEGMVYYDTTTKQLLAYANGKWQADRSNSTKIVGTSAVGGTSGAVASAAPDGADYVNTSTTSAQTVINSAITALPAGGGTVYLMEGTYIIDAAITVPSNVTITGTGVSTVLKLKNATNASINLINANGGTNKVISSLKLDGNSANNSSGTQRAIDYGGAGNSTTVGVVMDKLDVQNFRSESIYGVSGSHSKLTNSYIAANNEGIHSNGIDRIEISGNIFRAQTNNSISSYGSRARITNNNIVGGTGILTSTEGVVANNVVQGSTGNGINVGGTDSSITSNIVSGNAGIGIAVSNFTQRNTISGNTIADNGQHGIAFGLFTGSTTISNNTIHNSGTGTASSSGIAIDGYSGTNTITGNRITDTAGTGFAIFLNGPQNSNNYLSGNTFSGTGASSISDAADGTIYSNQVDASGNLINRGNNGLAVGALAASSTLTVQGGYVGQALGAPAQPTVVTQGTAGSTSYTYAVTAFDGFGETTASTVRVIATGNATLTGANFNRITWTRVSGAVSYKVYRTASGGTPATTGLIGTVGSNATLQLDDTGLAGSGTTPAVNTTGGLSVASNIQGANATLTGGSLNLGTTSQQGSLVLSDGSSNTATLQVGNLAGNYTYTIPVTTGNDTFCMLTAANCGGVSTIGALDGGTANATGATIAGSTLYLQSASGTNPGLVSTTTQTFAGNKTFTGTLSVQDTTVGAGTSITFVGGITSTRPAAPSEGMVYYDTTTKQLLAYANGKWQADRSSSTKIVGTSAVGGTSGAVASAAPDGADYINTSTTSAQTVINSAITAMPAGGGTVYLMEGTYIIDGSINLPANTALTGAGVGTVLKFKNSIGAGTLSMIDATSGGTTDKVISNLKLDGNSANNASGTHRGINFGGLGSSNTTGITLTGLNVQGFRNEALYAVGGTHTNITNNHIASNTYGVYLNGVQQAVVSGNVIRNNTTSGIFTTANRTRITNNKLDSNSTSINAAGAGTVIEANAIESSTGNSITFNGSRGTITGNTITTSTGDGIQLDGSVSQTVVSANTITSSGLDGIEVNNSSSNNTIADNIIYNSGTVTATRSGISINTNSDSNTVIGNQITDTAGTGYAITIPGPGNDSVGTYLSGNTYSGAGATSISDSGTGTIYANQLDANGHLINRGTAAMSVNTSTVTSSLTLQGGLTNTQLPTPALPVITRVGTAGTTTYGYKVTALDGTGETLPSTEGTIATANATLTGANYNTITWSPVPGAVQYKIYRTASGGTPASTGLIGTVNGSATSVFNDTGIAATTATPAANTTGGLSVASNIQGSNATFTGGTLTLGATSQQGSLVISDGSSNTATIQVGNLAGNYTYTIPVTTGNDTFCMLLTANCSGGGVSAIGALDGGTANATGATISGSTLYLQSASGTNPGLVNTTAQTFAGDKTFNGILSVQDVTVGAGKTIYVTGGATGTRPGTPTEGMVYFDTTTKQLITYANGKWQASRSSSTKIVAASNSSQAAKDAADYIATGTGDQAQINTALTAAAGGTVYLMEGIYYMSAQVSVPNNTTLSGAGPGTILTIPNAQNGTYSIVRNTDTSTGTNVIVRDLQIDGNRANQTGGSMTGISLANMGAGTGSTARIGSKLTNLIVKNMRQDRGVSLTGSNNIISGSTFQYNEIQAINLSGSNNVITGNTFHGNQNYTINVGGSYNTVSNNLVESGGADGIRMGGTYGTVTGNTVTTSGSAGIIASGAHATVTGNTVSANNGVGIHVSADYGTVTGNSVSANTSEGIRLQTNYSVASGNNVDNNSQDGIMIFDDNNQISGNRIHNNGSEGIECFGTCNNNSIVGNHITDTAGSGFAIQLTNFAGTPTGNYLSGNTFSGVGASSINDEGVGTIYSSQRDGNGNTINRTQGGALTIGTNTASASLTLQGGMVASQLVAPTLSATVANVGTAGVTTYRYQVTALDGTGETVGSTIQQTTTGNATLSGSNYNTITWAAVPGAYQYSIYKCSGAGCTPLKKTTVAGNATSFNDQSAGSPVGAAPGTNTTGGATFAGGIQGSTASLSGTLTVAGATTLNGTLTGTGTALFKNTANSATAFQIQDSSSVALFTADTSATKIVIRTLDVSYNLTVAGHIVSGGSTPAIAADAAACTSPTVGVSGTDTAGTITVTTGTGCASPGNISTITFSTAFGAAPKVTLTPASAAAAGLNAYLDDATISTGSFKVGVANTPADSTVYKWNYHAVQ